jgi:hypothetical protein
MLDLCVGFRVRGFAGRLSTPTLKVQPTMNRVHLYKSFFFALLALTLSALASVSRAASDAQLLDRNGVAVSGYDPVAFFVEGKAVLGKSDLSVRVDNGPIYHFASAENRTIFMADPVRYTPQFGGYCAYGAAFGAKAAVDPKAFRIVDGKLYLQSSASIASRWSQDATNLIKKAQVQWASAR